MYLFFFFLKLLLISLKYDKFLTSSTFILFSHLLSNSLTSIPKYIDYLSPPLCLATMYLFFQKYNFISRSPNFQSNSPLKHLGSGGFHLLFDWHHTMLLPFMVKPGLHLNITVSFKKNKCLNPDSIIPFSTSGIGHLTKLIHWGGGLLQMPTWLSLLVQYIDFSPTRSNSFFPFFPTWHR